MKRLLIALSFVLGACASAGYLQTTEVNDFSAMRATVKLVYNDFGNGSGVMVAPHLLITNAHVAGEMDLKVDGQPVKVLKIDQDTDLALLEVVSDCPCAVLGQPPVQDEPVVAIGYPLGISVQVQILTEGRVQGLRTIKDKETDGVWRLMVTTPVAPGNSGGGLFDKGKLVGIPSAIGGKSGLFGESILFTHLTYAVDIDTIKNFLKGTIFHG